MYAIETKNLTKRYKDVTAVDNLCFTVESGEIFALLGVNGAGKTTTVKMLCGLVKPTDGDALLLGKSICRDGAQISRQIALSPQETAVCRALTVRENLQLMAGIYGLKGAQAKQKVGQTMEQLGLVGVENKRASKLSGGYQRRLGIAMALIGEPQILFLDEPSQGVDVIARAEIWQIIREVKGKATVVLTTHDMEEAEALADSVAIMNAGKLIAHGSVLQLKKQAQTDDFTQAFIRIVKGENLA